MFDTLGALTQLAFKLSYKIKGGNQRFNDALLRRGLVLHEKNYYAPFVGPSDIKRSTDTERRLPGLDLNVDTQGEFLRNLKFTKELLDIPEHLDGLDYGYLGGMFGPGDAEIFYGAIRYLKPTTLIEVGAGGSTLLAQRAIRRNREEDSAYRCRHICVEPYENSWLEELPIEVIRKPVEECPPDMFQALERNDILFIDSSHVVKPQGDVLYEVFDIYGTLRHGVYVHVHDIFTPHDYPREWIIDQRKLWHEQYLLEAFLSFNRNFEIVCALNWLWKNHKEMLESACPVLSTKLQNNPGSFWFRRI